jgi:predicted PurR-regulated permease PerM
VSIVVERRLARFITFASFVLVIAVLRLAADVLIPLALATLLAFLLSPLVVWFTRHRVPKILAIAATVTVFFAVLGGLGWIVVTQAVNLAERLPDYEQNIRVKIDKLRHPQTPAALSRTSEMLEHLKKEVQGTEPANTTTVDRSEPAPIPVQIKEPERSALSLVRRLAAPVLGPLGMAGIIIVLVVAMLFQRDDLRDRFIKLVSSGRLNLATQALGDAARRVTRYLLMQLVVNATYGIPVGVALWFIGVPSAILWGVLATLLRFIPFLGPWVAASFPVALTLAVDPGWRMVLSTLGVFVFMEIVSNNVIEVRLYGASTGISNLALLVAAVYWTWLWGPAGLVLSTPLTVCVLVIGRHVPGLKFLSMLLGSGPVLEPPAQFYQRMLSMDADEMMDLARTFIKERSLTAFYDDVFVPALRMAENDREAGTLAEVRQKFIIQAGRDLIEELSRDESEALEKKGPLTPPGAAVTILGVPARDDADELVALMLAHVLRTQRLTAEVMPLAADPTHARERLSHADVRVVFISALPPSAVTAGRQAFRRLRRYVAGAPVLIGVWNHEASPADLERRLGLPNPGDAVITLAEAAVSIAARVAAPQPVTRQLTPAPVNPEELRIEEWFDHFIRELAQAFGVPVSLVSLVELDPAFWKERAATLPTLAKASEAVSDDALCGVVLAQDENLLVAEDVTKDKRLAENTVLTEGGVRFYAGVALQLKNGHPVGVLSVSDTKARTPPPEAVRLLREGADDLIARLEERAAD